MSSNTQGEKKIKLEAQRRQKKMWRRSDQETFLLTSVEEHVTHNSGAAVYFEGVSAQDNPLQHDTPGIAAEQTACGHEVLDAFCDETTES